MSSGTDMGSSPCKKRKINHTEARESNKSVEKEEEAKLPENNTASESKEVAAPNTVAVGGGSSAEEKNNTVATTTTNDSTTTQYSYTNTTVYVGGLHPLVQQAHVEKLLGKYGTIQRLDMLTNKHCCFCHYESLDQAQMAISNLHGRSLLKQTLKVQLANQKSRHDTISGSWNRSRGMSNKTTSLDHRIQALKRKLKEKR